MIVSEMYLSDLMRIISEMIRENDDLKRKHALCVAHDYLEEQVEQGNDILSCFNVCYLSGD